MNIFEDVNMLFVKNETIWICSFEIMTSFSKCIFLDKILYIVLLSKATYVVILAGAQALIGCQVLLNSKFRLLYVSDAVHPSDNQIFTQYRVLEKDAFSPCWELFLVSRIYDRKTWQPNKKYELQKLALTQLDSQSLKRFSHLFEQVQAVKQQIEKEPETTQKKQGTFRTYLWASLTGKTSSFYQSMSNFVGKAAKNIAKYLGFKKEQNQQELQQMRQQKNITQNQILQKAKKIKQHQLKDQQLTNQILQNMTTKNILTKAILNQNAEVEAIGHAQRNFEQEKKDQNLIQAGKALIAASNANNESQLAKTMMAGKLISKQLDAVDEKRMFQEQRVERNENEMQQEIPQQQANSSRNLAINAAIRQIDQPNQQPNQQPQTKSKKRRIFSNGKMLQQMAIIKKVYDKLQKHSLNFDKKIALIVQKTSTQKLDNIIKGQIELKQQIEQFRTKTLELLNKRNTDIDLLKKNESSFQKRIEYLEEQKMMTDLVNRQLNSQIVDSLQSNVSSSQFFRDILNKIQENFSKQSASYQTLVKGIQELKAGSDKGALEITKNATNYLSEISFNSYAAMTKLSIEQIRAMVKATPQQILTHFNSSAGLISNELNKSMSSLKTESKSILQGISYLTSTVQLLIQQKKSNYDISIIQAFNTTIRSQCQKIMNLVTIAITDMKQNNVQVKQTIISNMRTMNSYIQTLATQTQSHVTQCFVALQSSLSNQFQTVRAYQHQIVDRLEQNKRQNEINRMFLEQNRVLVINQSKKSEYFNQVNFQQHENRSIQNRVINQKVDAVLKKLSDVSQQKNKELQNYKIKFFSVSQQKQVYVRELQEAALKIKKAQNYNQQLTELLRIRKQQDRQIAEMIRYASRMAINKSFKPIKNLHQLKQFIYTIDDKIKDIDFTQISQSKQHIIEAASERRKKDIQIITKLKADILQLHDQVTRFKTNQMMLQSQLDRAKQTISRLNDFTNGQQKYAEANTDLLQDLKDLSSFLAYGITLNSYQTYRTSDVTKLFNIIQRSIAGTEQRTKAQMESLQKKLKQSISQLQHLKKKTARINADITQKESHIIQIERQKANFQQNIFALQKKLQESQHNRVLEMKDNLAVEKISLQLKNVRQQLKDKLLQFGKLTTESSQKAVQLAGKRNEARKLTQELQEKNEDIKRMKGQYTKQINLKDAYIRELQQKVNIKTKQAQSNKNKLKNVKKQQGVILDLMGEGRFEDMSDLLKDKVKRIEVLNRQLTDSRVKVDSLTKIQIQNKNKIGNLNNKISNLETKLDDQQKKTANITLVKTKMQLQIKNFEERIRQNTSKIKDLEDKIQALEKQKKRKQESYIQTNINNARFQQDLKHTKRKIATLELEMSGIVEQNESLKKLNEKFSKSINILENQAINNKYTLKLKQEAIGEIRQTLAKLQKQVSKKNQIISVMQKKIRNQQDQSSRKDKTMDQIKQMMSELNIKSLTSKVIKKKLIDYEVSKESQYNENLKRAISRMTESIRQIDRDYIDWNKVIKQIKQLYGISEQISVDFSNAELSENLITFLHQKRKQSENKKYQLEKASLRLTEQLEQAKKKIQESERLVRVLIAKHQQQKEGLEQKVQKYQSKLSATAGVTKKLQQELNQTKITLLDLQNKLRDKQYSFQLKLLQYNQFLKQKQQLAIALCLNKSDTVITILQKIIEKFKQLPQRGPGVGDQAWIAILVQTLQEKRSRKNIRSDDGDEEEKKSNTQTKLKIIAENNMEIKIQSSTMNIEIPIGGNGGGGGEEPPRKPNSTSESDTLQTKIKDLESQYQLAKIDHEKLKKDFERLQHFMAEFEKICIFLLQKFMKFLTLCSEYLASFRKKNYTDPQKQKVTGAFLLFIGSLIDWVHRIFENINFDQFIADYIHLKYDLNGVAKKLGSGSYLIDNSNVKGVQLRTLLNQISTYIKSHIKS